MYMENLYFFSPLKSSVMVRSPPPPLYTNPFWTMSEVNFILFEEIKSVAKTYGYVKKMTMKNVWNARGLSYHWEGNFVYFARRSLVSVFSVGFLYMKATKQLLICLFQVWQEQHPQVAGKGHQGAQACTKEICKSFRFFSLHLWKMHFIMHPA